MALKKRERIETLREIYGLLAKAGDCSKEVTQARKKVIDMLTEDGIFILESR